MVGVLLALLRLTVKTALSPSSTWPPALSTAGLTVLTVGAASLSMMVAVPVLPPTVRLNVSVGSLTVSLMVGTVTVKLVTPAGTVSWPVIALYTTPLLKLWLFSAAL